MGMELGLEALDREAEACTENVFLPSCTQKTSGIPNGLLQGLGFGRTPAPKEQEMDLRQLAPAKGSWLLSLSSGQSRSEDSSMEGLTARMLVVQGEPLEQAAGTQVRTPALARTEADSQMGLFVKVLCTAPVTQSPTRTPAPGR